MKNDWRNTLRYDPLPPLLAEANPAIGYFVRRDLLGEELPPIQSLWRLPVVTRLVRRQLPSGAWKYPAGNSRIRSDEDYNQIETFRNLGILVEQYGMTRKHGAIRKAATFLFSRQTTEGDFRGILGRQYAPYYTGAIMELLIKAGYADDRRIQKAFRWLIAMRQDDGGWAIPLRTRGISLTAEVMGQATIEPDRSRPFSHLATGMVLRALAAHPEYRKSHEARMAGQLLASRLFCRDAYPDRGAADYWERFSFPFWFTDLLSALDSLSRLGLAGEDARIKRAVKWFAERQEPDGLWKLKLLRNKDPDLPQWIALAICRVIRRLA